MRWLLVLLVACSSKQPDEALELGPYLQQVAALEPTPRREVIEGWLLDREHWHKVVVPPFDTLFDEYQHGFHTFANLISRQLPDGVTVRRHYADDRGHGEKMARWGLPVLAESYAISTPAGDGGVAFLRVDGRWKVVELAAAIYYTMQTFDRACAKLYLDGDTTKPCRDIGWELADAALRNQRDRFDHACTIARTACGKPSP